MPKPAIIDTYFPCGDRIHVYRYDDGYGVVIDGFRANFEVNDDDRPFDSYTDPEAQIPTGKYYNARFFITRKSVAVLQTLLEKLNDAQRLR